MKVRNQMEDLVLSIVDEIFDSREIQEKDICTCSQCRLDVACFALNRLQPEYVISSRGLAYMKADYHTNIQRSADVVQLVKKGLEIVSKSKRPGFSHNDQMEDEIPDRPAYNFPVISGRIFNGTNFEPLLNKQVSLSMDGGPVAMFDSNWQNPYTIVSTIPGNYMFWPAPVDAPDLEKSRTFSFAIRLLDESFCDFTHVFDLEIKPSPRVMNSLQTNHSYNIQDLYVFPQDYCEEGLDSVPGGL